MTSSVVDISPNDDRLYKFIKLENGIEAILIHDPKTEKSSACCDVQIGSMADPKEANGYYYFKNYNIATL